MATSDATSDPEFVADSSWLGHSQDGPSCSTKLAFYQHWVQGWVNKSPKAPQDPSLPVSARQLAVNQSLKQLFLNWLLEECGRWGP